ncbi:MAG TPA: DUF1214 domain-containing protein [Xanthobacteraceae bacterium]|nr:DUF1214 domain-containing protein [Xanthobacteraceae bacterium]
MRLLLASLYTFILAAAIGLGGTWFALTREAAFGALRIGAWTARPKTGTRDIDPYARAGIARSGALPIGLGDGVSFIASSDDKNRPLDGRCDTLVSGTTPTARYFTITLYEPDGRLIANSLDRHGFTSEELIRNQDGSFEIAVAPRARPGNWLPTGGVDRYVLVLRFYDSSVGVATRAEREAPMPAIVTAGACS